MHDPLEGVTALGTIRTGASRERFPTAFEPVLNAVVGAVHPTVSLYVYGSVATGVAEPPTSDVDLLSVGLAPEDAENLSRGLSAQFSGLCRAVEIAAAQPSDFEGASDEAYGGRVFLRHYCVHLAGPDLHSALPDFPADAKAARGFNGDIGTHAERWRREVSAGSDPAQLGRRVARKSLLAVAGLVSVHDAIWTTDRARAAARWGEIEPGLASETRLLLGWTDGGLDADQMALSRALDGIVSRIVDSFDSSIGLWGSEPAS